MISCSVAMCVIWKGKAPHLSWPATSISLYLIQFPLKIFLLIDIGRAECFPSHLSEVLSKLSSDISAWGDLLSTARNRFSSTMCCLFCWWLKTAVLLQKADLDSSVWVYIILLQCNGKKCVILYDFPEDFFIWGFTDWVMFVHNTWYERFSILNLNSANWWTNGLHRVEGNLTIAGEFKPLIPFEKLKEMIIYLHKFRHTQDCIFVL